MLRRIFCIMFQNFRYCYNTTIFPIERKRDIKMPRICIHLIEMNNFPFSTFYLWRYKFFVARFTKTGRKYILEGRAKCSSHKLAKLPAFVHLFEIMIYSPSIQKI